MIAPAELAVGSVDASAGCSAPPGWRSAVAVAALPFDRMLEIGFCGAHNPR